MKKFSLPFTHVISLFLCFQLISCGTILYPDRRNQKSGRLDVGVAVLDTVCLLFGIIPGIIAFAVDFSTGAIYLPADGGKITLNKSSLRTVKFDPKNYTIASLEAMIRKETGQNFHFSDPRLQMVTIKDESQLPVHFAQFHRDTGVQLSLANIK